jgi:hypothetical protein
MLDFFVDLNSTDMRIVNNAKPKPVQEFTGKVGQIFSAINKNINSDLVNKTGAIFQFVLKGWYIIYIYISLLIFYKYCR